MWQSNEFRCGIAFEWCGDIYFYQERRWFVWLGGTHGNVHAEVGFGDRESGEL